jgi:hypothetical protein
MQEEMLWTQPIYRAIETDERKYHLEYLDLRGRIIKNILEIKVVRDKVEGAHKKHWRNEKCEQNFSRKPEGKRPLGRLRF